MSSQMTKWFRFPKNFDAGIWSRHTIEGLMFDMEKAYGKMTEAPAPLAVINNDN